MPLQDKYPKSSPPYDFPILSLEDPEIILKFILSGTRGPCTRRPPGLCPSCPPHCYAAANRSYPCYASSGKRHAMRPRLTEIERFAFVGDNVLLAFARGVLDRRKQKRSRRRLARVFTAAAVSPRILQSLSRNLS